MIILVLLVLKVHSCDTELSQLLNKEFNPRIEAFHNIQKGLDSIESFTKCKQISNSTYATVLWISNGFYKATFSFCLPIQCSKTRAEQILETYIKRANIESSSYLIEFIDFNQEKNMSLSGKFFLAFFILVLLFNGLSPLTRNFKNGQKFFSCFNPLKYLQNLVDGGRPGDSIDALDGFRSISSVFIVWFHVLVLQDFLPKENRALYIENKSNLGYTSLCSLSLGVDVLILIAGFLMSVQTVKQLRVKKQGFNWILHFIRRYFRYIPAYLVLVGLQRITEQSVPKNENILIPFIHSKRIQTPWWASLFLIHNLLVGDDVMYLGWTWTVCVDFQLFIVCSVIIYFYCKNKTFGYFIGLLMVLVSVAYTWYLADLYQVNLDYEGIVYNRIIFNSIYMKPLHRCMVYVSGMILGLIYLSNTKQSESEAFSYQNSLGDKFEKKCLLFVQNKENSKFLYRTGVILVLLCYTSPYYFKENENSISQFYKSSAYSLFRLIFAIGFIMCLFPIILGKWESAENFLKLQIFKSYSKISYSMYLFHYLIIFSSEFSGAGFVEYNLLFGITSFIRVFIISLIFSTAVYVLVECPAFELERKIFPR